MPIIFSLNTEIMKILPIFLTTTGTFYQEIGLDRPEGFTEYQFNLTVEGEGVIEFQNKKVTLKPGTLLYLPPHIPHKYHKPGDKWITHWLTFDGNNIEKLFDAVLPKNIEVIKTNINDPINNQMIEVNNLTFKNYKNNALKISSIIYGMIADFVKKTDNRDQNSSNITHVDKTLEYMANNYANDITLEELADLNNISAQYLCRVFKLQIGLRPFEYLKQFRINRSKTLLLETTGKKIEDIAKDVGFNNPSYFGAIFRQYENMTPKEFLKLHKK